MQMVHTNLKVKYKSKNYLKENTESMNYEGKERETVVWYVRN